MHYMIYKTINIINNKSYIGCHKTKDINDDYFGSGKLLKAAIKKYGKINFKKQILWVFDNPKEMYNKEIELVNEKFIKNNNNYNIKVGGLGGNITKETALLISKKLKGKKKSKETKEKMKIANIGKSLSENTKKKISDSLRKTKYTHGPSAKQKMSKAAKNRINNCHDTKWITNGISDRRIVKDSVVPEGWRLGRSKGNFHPSFKRETK